MRCGRPHVRDQHDIRTGQQELSAPRVLVHAWIAGELGVQRVHLLMSAPLHCLTEPQAMPQTIRLSRRRRCHHLIANPIMRRFLAGPPRSRPDPCRLGIVLDRLLADAGGSGGRTVSVSIHGMYFFCRVRALGLLDGHLVVHAEKRRQRLVDLAAALHSSAIGSISVVIAASSDVLAALPAAAGAPVSSASTSTSGSSTPVPGPGRAPAACAGCSWTTGAIGRSTTGAGALLCPAGP